MISVSPADWLFICGKNFNFAIFWDTKTMINVKLHEGSSHWVLTIHVVWMAKLTENYHHAKFDIYHSFSVWENGNVKVFATYEQSVSWIQSKLMIR